MPQLPVAQHVFDSVWFATASISAASPLRPDHLGARLAVFTPKANPMSSVSNLPPSPSTAQALRDAMCAVRSIDYTVVFARDLLALRRFYGETLGFPLQRQLGERWFEYRIGTNTLALTVYQGGSILSGSMFSILGPSGEALFVFGASGRLPVFSYHRWWTVLSAGWLHAGALHIPCPDGYLPRAALGALLAPILVTLYRTELAMSVFGRAYGANISGKIFKDGQEIRLRSVRDAYRPRRA